jgi:hypothetical protein
MTRLDASSSASGPRAVLSTSPLATGLWNDPGNWGVVLADLARHVARSYELTGKVDQTTALKRIRELFEAEWSHPTDEPTGNIQA